MSRVCRRNRSEASDDEEPELVEKGNHQTLGLLAYLRFEGGWGGFLGGLTTEPEDMVGALGNMDRMLWTTPTNTWLRGWGGHCL